MKTFKYRLRVNKTVEEKLQWTLGACCEVYNAALQERRDMYTACVRNHPNYYDETWRKQAHKDHNISLYDQQNQLSPLKKDRTELIELSAAHILNDVCNRVDKAFKGFFARCQRGLTPGYPRFRSRARYDSFTYPDKTGWKVTGTTLTLTRIGTMQIKLHRPIEGIVKTCTIKREGAHWYVMFACEVAVEQLPLSYEDVGIDLGVLHLATLSTGETIEHPRHLRRQAKRHAELQQAVPRRNPGTKASRRYQKAQKKVSASHRKVRNQRADFLHKESRKLVQRYQVVVFEELVIANLVKRPKPQQDAITGTYLPNGASAKGGLNTSILDAGWGMFQQYCRYKAANAGREVLFVNPKYTSQTCSGCGKRVKKLLSERWYSCECGVSLDRDHNAALNILRLGQHQQREGIATEVAQ